MPAEPAAFPTRRRLTTAGGVLLLVFRPTAKETRVSFVRRRPLLAAILAFMHFPIFMGLWVMATETAADVRARLSAGDDRLATLTGGRRSAAS